MKGTTHLTAGIIAGMMFTAATNQPESISATIIITTGILALVPDIDKPSSTIGRRIPLFSIPASLAGHRNLFHAPLLYIAIYTVLLIQFHTYTLWFTAGLIGVASHILLDMFNPAGIPLLYPFASKRFHIANIRSGGIIDWLVGISLFAIILAILFL